MNAQDSLAAAIARNRARIAKAKAQTRCDAYGFQAFRSRTAALKTAVAVSHCFVPGDERSVYEYVKATFPKVEAGSLPAVPQ